MSATCQSTLGLSAGSALVGSPLVIDAWDRPRLRRPPRPPSRDLRLDNPLPGTARSHKIERRPRGVERLLDGHRALRLDTNVAS
jgi:hypothetical protein